MRRPSARSARALCLVALVVLAGCNGFVGGGSDSPDTDDEGAASVTPAPVPTTAAATGTAAPETPEPLPPGIGETGIFDAEALADAHRSVLANRTFSVSVARTGDRSAGPARYTIHVANESRYLLTTDDEATDLVYADRDAQFYRDFDSESADPAVRSERVTMSPSTRIRPYTLGLDRLPERAADLTRVRRDGRTFLRVHVTGYSERVDAGNYSRSVGPFGEVSNYSLTAYVRPDGFVRTVDLSYDSEYNGTRTHVERRFTYALDTGPVVEPDWAARTRNGNLSALSAGEYPPGVDESGLRDSGELWNAHRTVLAVNSFTLNRSGSQAWGALPERTTVAVENRRRFLRQPQVDGDAYSDASGHYRRDTEAGNVRVGPPREYWVTHPTRHGQQWLRGNESTVERVERNGTTRFRVTVTRPPTWLDVPAANFTATALVRPDGLIREISIDATVRGVTQADGTGYVWTDVEYRYRYTDIGTTTLTEPEWVTRAKRNETNTRYSDPLPTTGPGSEPEPVIDGRASYATAPADAARSVETAPRWSA